MNRDKNKFHLEEQQDKFSNNSFVWGNEGLLEIGALKKTI